MSSHNAGVGSGSVVGVGVGVGVGRGVLVGSGVGVGGRVGVGVGAAVGVGVGAAVGVGLGVGLGVGPGVLVAAGGSVTTVAGVPGAAMSADPSGRDGSVGLGPDGVPLAAATGGVPLASVLDPGSGVEPPGGSMELGAPAIPAGLGPPALEAVRAGGRDAAPIMIAAISAGSSATTTRRTDRG